MSKDVANDFNNLLSVIQSTVSLVLFDMDATDPHCDMLKRIEKQVRNGSRLRTRLQGKTP
jgi:hypothetical protein